MKSNLGFIGLTLSYHNSSLKEIKTGTQSGAEPGDRSWCKRNGGFLLTGLFIMVYSEYFFYRPQNHSLAMATPTLSWTFHCHSLIKKKKNCPTGLLNWHSFWPEDSGLYQVDIKLFSKVQWHLWNWRYGQWIQLFITSVFQIW